MITCTATTRLTYAECMAALAACPALPRGERCSYWHPERKHLHGFKEYEHKKPWQRLVTRSLVLGVVDLHGREAMRYYASPLRRLRDERRALKARIRELEAAGNAMASAQSAELCTHAGHAYNPCAHEHDEMTTAKACWRKVASHG